MEFLTRTPCLQMQGMSPRESHQRGPQRTVRNLPDGPSAEDQCFSGDLEPNVGLKNQRATAVCRNPLIYLVAGAGFEPATFGL